MIIPYHKPYHHPQRWESVFPAVTPIMPTNIPPPISMPLKSNTWRPSCKQATCNNCQWPLQFLINQK